MRDADAATIAALALRQLKFRNLIWITPFHLTTGAPLTPVGYWADNYDASITLIDGVTGASVARTYSGAGEAVTFERIVLTASIEVRMTAVDLNMLNTSVNNLVRGTNLQKAPVEIHRVLFNVETKAAAGVPRARFVGFVGRVQVITPPSGGVGSARLSMVSHSRELTRGNPAKRSDAAQQKRSAGDRFRQYAGPMAQRMLFWGTGNAVATHRIVDRRGRTE